MANTVKDTIKTRKIAILAADGVDEAAVSAMTKAWQAAGAQVKLVAPRLGALTGAKGNELQIDFSLLTTSSVLFDAVYVPGGAASVETLLKEPDAVHFVNEAYKHCKAIAASGEGAALLHASYVGAELSKEPETQSLASSTDPGLVVSSNPNARKVADAFIAAIAQHRHWEREQKDQVPA